jgi:hypothetical protein
VLRFYLFFIWRLAAYLQKIILLQLQKLQQNSQFLPQKWNKSGNILQQKHRYLP